MYGYGGVDIGCVAVVDVRYLGWGPSSPKRGVAGMGRVARIRYPGCRNIVLRLEAVVTGGLDGG